MSWRQFDSKRERGGRIKGRGRKGDKRSGMFLTSHAHKEKLHKLSKIKLTGFSGLKPNSFGFKMAGAKNLKKMKPLIAVYLTSSSKAINEWKVPCWAWLVGVVGTYRETA